MSKLKFLLLGGLFTLVGIFNFSSADCITYVGDEYNGTNAGYLHRFDFTEGQSFKVIRASSTWVRSYGGTTDLCLGLTSSQYISAGETYTFTTPLSKCEFGVVRGDFSIEICTPDPPIIAGGTTALTPAFDGLKSSVSQIIPLVIYIGIGILLAVLGFYAIRRLVNWLGKKINSVFRSKRG